MPAASAPRLQAQPADLRAPGGCARPGQQGAAARGACQDADGAEEGELCHGRPCSCSCVHPKAGWELALLLASSQNPAAPQELSTNHADSVDVEYLRDDGEDGRQGPVPSGG